MSNRLSVSAKGHEKAVWTGAPFAFGTALLVVGFIVAAMIKKESTESSHTLSLADPAAEPLLPPGAFTSSHCFESQLHRFIKRAFH